MTMRLIRTTPPDHGGSMAAYAEMVKAALETVPEGAVETDWIEAHSGRSRHDMWQQHVWRWIRMRQAVRAVRSPAWFHLLDGSMAALVPPAWRSRTLVSVHDLIPFLMLRGDVVGRTPSGPARRLLRRTAEALRACRALCANSAITARDCAQILGVKDVPVIPLVARALPESRTSVAVPTPYILHIGHNGEYKNRQGVLTIFAQLRQRHGDLRLVMAGAPPTTALKRQATAVGQVHFIVHPPDTELAALYRHAVCLLFPSWYEGFGMPVLEAMRLGCPVICSHQGSLPEVAGDAADTASASDVNTFARLCARLLADPSHRARLRENGYRQAARYNLKHMGAQLVSWYESVCTSSLTVCPAPI